MMRNYLLTVIGNFKSDELCSELAITLTPIVDSPNLKFSFNEGVMLFYFATEISKEEIYDYVLGILYGITSSFILTEVNDDITVSLPEKTKKHLLDLENDSDEDALKINLDMAKDNFGYDRDDIDDEDFIGLLEQTRPIIKKPSLDQILDKYLEKGYNSLSQFEKDLLENYSKN